MPIASPGQTSVYKEALKIRPHKPFKITGAFLERDSKCPSFVRREILLSTRKIKSSLGTNT